MEAGHLMTLAYLIPIPGTMHYELPDDWTKNMPAQQSDQNPEHKISTKAAVPCRLSVVVSPESQKY
jgi:hypothetical protein